MGWAPTTVRRLRTAVLRLCRGAGVHALVRDSRWRQQRLLLIGYHGVAIDDEHEWKPHLFVSTESFEARLDMIKRGGYSVLPLDEALLLLKQQALPPRSVVLTFDDGYYNYKARAYPALRARGFPSTVYLTTYYSEFNRPIYNLGISYVLWKAGTRSWHPRALRGFSGDYTLPAMRWNAWIDLVNYGEREALSGAEKDALLDAVADSLHVDLGAVNERRLLHLMKPGEVAELARAGVDFQMHSHRHKTPRDEAFLHRDLVDNEIRIERFTGTRPVHFCYPNGDYHEALSSCLRQLDVRSATTCVPGLAAHNTPMLELPRLIDTMEISPLAFEGWLSGIQSLVSRPHA
ncbi:MAG TPA: polysaccharide deacetylase family protein [Vicinamibacterales bacterium]|jgi:peptidoglycan/xylan/chitin deacetylase (PgdA/CDA1 family)|nr:polysaccharide deacetylase family protein [Vicinamibacterales bacterium]